MTAEVSDVAAVSEQSLVSEISTLRQRLTIAERELRAVDDELMWEGTVLNRIETLQLFLKRAALTQARLAEAMGMLESIAMLEAAKQPIDRALLERLYSFRSSVEEDVKKLECH